MINHIDEHNTGILDFPAFYNLVKKKSREQVNITRLEERVQKLVCRTRKITSRMHSGLSARIQEVGVLLNANFRVHNWIPHVKLHLFLTLHCGKTQNGVFP